MHFILWLVVGGVAGWLAGLIMRDQGGILINIVVGIVGAAIAGFIFGGGADLNQALTIQSFIYSIIGAVILLAIVNLVRRGRVR